MACPTCGHQMSRIGTKEPPGSALWACPRCGTIIEVCFGETCAAIVPKLVKRCREFMMRKCYVDEPIMELFHQTGIAEAIYPPKLRPQRKNQS